MPVVSYGKEEKDLNITKWLAKANMLCEDTDNYKEDQRLYRGCFSNKY